MLDSVCPALTDTLAWLPFALVAAVLADVVVVLAGAFIIRGKRKIAH